MCGANASTGFGDVDAQRLRHEQTGRRAAEFVSESDAVDLVDQRVIDRVQPALLHLDLAHRVEDLHAGVRGEIELLQRVDSSAKQPDRMLRGGARQVGVDHEVIV